LACFNIDWVFILLFNKKIKWNGMDFLLICVCSLCLLLGVNTQQMKENNINNWNSFIIGVDIHSHQENLIKLVVWLDWSRQKCFYYFKLETPRRSEILKASHGRYFLLIVYYPKVFKPAASSAIFDNYINNKTNQ